MQDKEVIQIVEEALTSSEQSASGIPETTLDNNTEKTEVEDPYLFGSTVAISDKEVVPPKFIAVAVNRNILDSGTPILGRSVFMEVTREGKKGKLIASVVRIRQWNINATFNVKFIMEEHSKLIRDTFKLDDQVLAICAIQTLLVEEKTPDGKSVYYRAPVDIYIPTGQRVYFTEKLEQYLTNEKLKGHLFYMGHLVDGKSLFPLYINDFSKTGGGIHSLIAGTTGSGKTNEVKKLIVGYATRTSKTKVLILDPQGEFSKALKGIADPQDTFGLSLKEVLEKSGIETEVYPLSKLALPLDSELFKRLLISLVDFSRINVYGHQAIEKAARHLAFRIGFEDIQKEEEEEEETSPREQYMQKIVNNISDIITLYNTVKSTGVKADVRKRSFNKLREILFGDKKPAVKGTKKTETEEIWEFAEYVYRSDSNRIETSKAIDNDKKLKAFVSSLCGVLSMFDYNNANKVPIVHIAEKMVSDDKKKVISIDLSDMPWKGITAKRRGIEIKPLLIGVVLSEVYKEANMRYKSSEQENQANLLIVIDEAHRLVPSHSENDEIKNVASHVIFMLREVRKFGVGVLLVSTSLTNLNSEVIGLTRFKIYGAGLNDSGNEERIKHDVGEDGYILYEAHVKDPLDPMNPGGKDFRFLVSGPANVLGGKAPTVYRSYTNVKEFLKDNNL